MATLDSATKVDWSRLSFGTAYNLFESSEAFAEIARFVLSGYVDVELSDTDIRTAPTGTCTVERFAFSFDQARVHDLKERTYGLGLKMEYAMSLAERLGLKLNVEIGPYLYDFKREITETDRSSFILPLDNEFALNSTESDSGVGLRAHALLKLEYDLGGGFTIGAAGSYAWRSDGRGVFVPKSGVRPLADKRPCYAGRSAMNSA
ncbi:MULTISPECIES: hypothetical protein [Sphingomonadales]|uniref:Uncharacterized protein n=2 Tax=Sphingomonadales TaxID=204457 RepID=A0A0G3XL15_9SPHN|nr:MULTISPECIES: hypothetical protein [Sphingomonadales]MCB2075949.1 hypothetical protein [Novosphingobium sp.]AIT82684.1 hypothetical protein JI59_24855 [Novosphingobium pentaromativorans US6-1]AKM12190.1 hypothetical protein AB433_18815 [Croceicoccus naphthovorans]EHJ58072.1 hypothetical protein NSU_pLA1178 [Novosphingobium pentaromativorans US6-1]MBB3991064.1 hypothetical protein [Croceicoccus naphthovorans]